MRALALITRVISGFNSLLGQIFCWLAVGIVLVCFTVVVQRYLFAVSYVWLQDLYVWLNGVMFTGIAGYALLKNAHVRVDIFYRPASLRAKAWIDLAGTLVFLFPFVFVIVDWGWPYVMRSWQFNETSGNTDGLPGLYILKSFIMVFALVVGLQGVAWVCRSILVLTGREELLPEKLRYGKE